MDGAVHRDKDAVKHYIDLLMFETVGCETRVRIGTALLDAVGSNASVAVSGDITDTGET